jgi:hypothetical protein
MKRSACSSSGVDFASEPQWCASTARLKLDSAIPSTKPPLQHVHTGSTTGRFRRNHYGTPAYSHNRPPITTPGISQELLLMSMWLGDTDAQRNDRASVHAQTLNKWAKPSKQLSRLAASRNLPHFPSPAAAAIPSSFPHAIRAHCLPSTPGVPALYYMQLASLGTARGGARPDKTCSHFPVASTPCNLNSNGLAVWLGT